MAAIDLAASLVQLAGDLPLAHELGYPHQEPQKSSGGGGGASAVVIVAVIVATLALAGGLMWVRERARRADHEAPPAAD